LPRSDVAPLRLTSKGLNQTVENATLKIESELHTEKKGFVTATKLGTTNNLFVAATKIFSAATKRFS